MDYECDKLLKLLMKNMIMLTQAVLLLSLASVADYMLSLPMETNRSFITS